RCRCGVGHEWWRRWWQPGWCVGGSAAPASRDSAGAAVNRARHSPPALISDLARRTLGGDMRRLTVCAVTAVAGLALVSCSSAQRQPDPGDFIGTTTTPAIPAEGPVASAAGNVGRAQPSSSAADVNQKLRALARPDDETPDPRLGPGDLIEISVFEVPELSQIKVRIPNSGQVALLLVGSFPASGATALELQSQISNHLKTKFMHDPQGSV